MPYVVKMEESTGFDLHEPDEWLSGTIVDIQETEGKYGPQFKWVIDLDGEDRGSWAWCSQKVTEKTVLYSWLYGLTGTLPTLGADTDVREFVGTRCQVMFEQTNDDGIAKEKIVKIRAEKAKGAKTPLQQKQAEMSAARKPPPRETTDFADDEAPF